MKQLPDHILSALASKQTSLGHCPSFPEYEERDFDVELLTERYNELLAIIGSDNKNLLKRELKTLLRNCKQIEKECKSALERLCVSVVTDIFSIPENAINLEVSLVDKVDSSSQRMTPEDSTEFTFDDIEDMKNLTGEVHKRRLLNALITGASITIAGHISKYAGELFDINPDLPSMYKRIMAYNEMLSFVEEEHINSEEQASDGGKVDVTIGDPNSTVTINAEGVIFPILLEESVRGILELAISHGLPKSREKALYVVSKSDFKLAELWDMRFGISLWAIIEGLVKDDVEPNFLLMELSMLPVQKFNEVMTEIFAKTKSGQKSLSEIVEHIKKSKAKDDFDDFMTAKQNRHQMDDEFFTPDELITDSEE